MLILAMVIIFIVASSATTLLSIAFAGAEREKDRDFKFKAREVAEASLDISLSLLRQATDRIDNNGDGFVDEGIFEDDLFDQKTVSILEGNLGRIGTVNWTAMDDNNGNNLPDFGESNVTPLAFAGGDCITYSIFSENDGQDNDSDGMTDEDDEAGSVSIIAESRYENYSSRIRYTGIFTEFLVPPDPPEWNPEKALVVGDDVKVTGNCYIFGKKGNIHSNGSMVLGGSTLVTGDATASEGGHIDPDHVGGIVDESAPMMEMPYLNHTIMRAMRDEAMADGKDVYSLNIDGSVTENGIIVATGGNFKGWRMKGGRWTLIGNKGSPDGLIYSPMDVRIMGGHPEIRITVFSEGNIIMAGHGNFRAYHDDLFLVGLKDIRLSGTPQLFGELGAVFAREQVECIGNTFIRGVVLAGDWDDASSLVTTNTITGNFGVRYNGGFSTGLPVIDPNDKNYAFDPTLSSYEER
jgi:hypothetical protein